jgi:hypothetical protein
MRLNRPSKFAAGTLIRIVVNSAFREQIQFCARISAERFFVLAIVNERTAQNVPSR